MYNLAYSPRAQKALRRFPADYQRLILSKLPALKENPRPRGYDKIAAKKPPLYRIRIGAYRIFYFIGEETKSITIVDVERRTTQTYR